MTKNLIIGVFAVMLLLVAVYVTVEVVEAPETTPEMSDSATNVEPEDYLEFRSQLEEAVRIDIGQPIEGYEPMMFLQVFPGLEESDFDSVEALIGHYEYINGELVHDLEGADLIHSAAGTISEEGIVTLLENIIERLDIVSGLDIDVLISDLKKDEIVTPSPLPPEIIEDPVACTADAKICPDGTGVGRVGPNCEFAECPTVNEPKSITCTEQMKQAEVCTMEYAPVCGLVQVQCITTPCNPVPETFSNGCSACSRGNVISYTTGACEI